MRRSVAIFLGVNVTILILILHSIWTLLSLLVVDGSSDAILYSELTIGGNWLHQQEQNQLIPKIIHQTYKNETIPDGFLGPQKSCIDLHPDYEYKMWTDEMAREFISAEYPWFLSTWDNYPYNIQRADAIRYFVLLHYGGIYIDLDDGCQRSLDPLLQFPAWLRRAKPTGISNDVMGAVPNHPFFLRAVQSLQYYDRTWFLPYITVMGSTGPLFLSIIWRHYNTQTPSPTGLGRIRIMFPDEYMFTPWSFFIHNPGSSWHQGDARLIMWLRDNWFLITLSSTSVGLLVVYLVWALVTRFFSSSPSPAPSPTIRHARPNRVPTWLYGRLGYEPIIRRDV